MIRCRFAHNEQSGILQIGKSVGGFGLESAPNLQAWFYDFGPHPLVDNQGYKVTLSTLLASTKPSRYNKAHTQ